MRMYDLALFVIERCFLGSSSRKYFSRAWNGSRARTTAGTRDNHLLYSDWVCTAVMSNDVMKDLRG